MSSSSWKKEEITRILIDGGKIALRHYDAPTSSTKPDGSIVTNADGEIERLFQTKLEDSNRSRFFLGEESVNDRDECYFRNALANELYIVDPIDGTISYASHIPAWGISIGFARRGVLCEGAIYLPVTQELFVSENEFVYRVDLNDWSDSGSELKFERLNQIPDEYAADGVIAITQEMTKGGRISVPNPVYSICCAVLPLAYLLVGRVHVYLANLKLWDLAGGLAMLDKLGMKMIFISGETAGLEISGEVYNLDFNSPECWKIRKPCLFGHRDAIAEVSRFVDYP